MNFWRSLFISLQNRRIALGFFTAILLIASGFALSLYSYSRHNDDSRQVQHTYEVNEQLEDILSSLKDVETGARGYLATGDPTFLEPYWAALPQISKELTRLHRLLADSPAQHRRADTLAMLTAANLAIVKRQIIENNRLTPALRTTYLRMGKVRMDRVRVWTARMMNVEQTLMAERSARAARSYRNTLLVTFVLALLTLVVLGVSYRLLGAELKRRQQNEDQLRAYEAQLQAQIRQLEASNDELERFAFVASHDLQEPLRKIQSFASLLADRHASQLQAEGSTYLHKITYSAERMSRLIKDLHNFSRVSNQREGYQPVRLDEIVRHVLDDQELRIAAQAVQVEIGPLPTLQAVPSQMDHLFGNLIVNALKFTRPGVRPRLRIQGRLVDGAGYPGLTAGRRYVEITVADNGIGFDEKYLEHIFKVFQRLHGKTDYEGTGIGLAICKRVVVHHHGYITAHSRPGEGATFVVVLPESQSLPTYERFTSAQTHPYPAG